MCLHTALSPIKAVRHCKIRAAMAPARYRVMGNLRSPQALSSASKKMNFTLSRPDIRSDSATLRSDGTPWSLIRQPDFNGITVLVVDDDLTGRLLLEIFLKQLGANVVAVQSISEVITDFAALSPHLLISDICLRGENGCDLIRWVRSLPPDQGGDIPAIAVSADVRVETQQQSLEAGFQTFVAKPVILPTLALTIHRCLEQILI